MALVDETRPRSPIESWIRWTR